MWRKIELPEAIPVRLVSGDECYYAREYVSGGKFDTSEANRLISNFKKNSDRKGQQDWKYKAKAITQFAQELGELVKGGVVCSIPCSKRRDDPHYDSRLDEVLEKLARANPEGIVVERPFEIVESHQPAHAGGERGIDFFYDLLDWRGFAQVPDGGVILVDDVITTGSHFKACQRMILERYPDLKVCGVFWAKVIWPEINLALDFSNLDAPNSGRSS